MVKMKFLHLRLRLHRTAPTPKHRVKPKASGLGGVGQGKKEQETSSPDAQFRSQSPSAWPRRSSCSSPPPWCQSARAPLAAPTRSRRTGSIHPATLANRWKHAAILGRNVRMHASRAMEAWLCSPCISCSSCIPEPFTVMLLIQQTLDVITTHACILPSVMPKKTMMRRSSAA